MKVLKIFYILALEKEQAILKKTQSEVNTTYSFQNALLDKLIQHLTATKKMQIVSRATEKSVLLNDFDGMREVIRKFVGEIKKMDDEVDALLSEIGAVDRETQMVKKKSLTLRVFQTK